MALSDRTTSWALRNLIDLVDEAIRLGRSVTSLEGINKIKARAAVGQFQRLYSRLTDVTPLRGNSRATIWKDDGSKSFSISNGRIMYDAQFRAAVEAIKDTDEDGALTTFLVNQHKDK